MNYRGFLDTLYKTLHMAQRFFLLRCSLPSNLESDHDEYVVYSKEKKQLRMLMEI